MSEAAPARPPRVTGLDAARALALFGMFAAHIGNAGEYGPGGWRWLMAAHGRASALFAVLAGVSIALMLTRAAAANPVRYTRVRVAVRGGMLIVLGWLLQVLATPVDVILDNLGVMFLLALVAFRWRPWVLMVVGGGVLAVGRAVLVPLVDVLPRWLYELPVLHELWSPHYPALVWVGYLLVGMGVSRLAPWRGAALGRLFAAGAVLAVAAYGAGAWLLSSRGHEVDWSEPQDNLYPWYSLHAHGYTAVEMLGNVGVALAVMGACCWVAHVLPRLTWPLAAAGSMTLTLYSTHLVLIAIVGPEIVFAPSNVALIALCGACLAFASVWKWTVGQGPLEDVFTTASTAVADSDSHRARVSPQA